MLRTTLKKNQLFDSDPESGDEVSSQKYHQSHQSIHSSNGNGLDQSIHSSDLDNDNDIDSNLTSQDLRDKTTLSNLLNYITLYRPEEIELDVELKPFIPDMIPAVGDIDAFIKISDNQSTLGLTLVDEPGSLQSDQNILQLQLVALSKQSVSEVKVKSISVEEKSTELDAWIMNMQELSVKKLAGPKVTGMTPDLEVLMQVWPESFDSEISKIEMNDFKILDLDLVEYSRLLCVLLDIPCRGNSNGTMTALSVMMALYHEFKQSSHFKDLVF